MFLGIFADWDSASRTIASSISAFAGLVAMYRGTSSKHRRPVLVWLGGIVSLLGMLVIWASIDTLPHWLQWLMTAVALLVAWVVGRFTSIPVDASTPVQAETPLEILSVNSDFSDKESVNYKKKLCVILKNAGDREIVVGPGAAWITGEILVRYIKQLVWELEPDDGWQSDKWKWEPAEKAELRVPPGRAFRTWVALHDNASKSELDRLRGRLGSLTFALRVMGPKIERKIKV